MGAKGAAVLLNRYATLEQILADGRHPEQADELRLYQKIATMDARAPLPALGDQSPSWATAAALAHAWGLNALAHRLEELASPVR